jgi:hypothetical protein
LKFGKAKLFFSAAIILLVLSVSLGLASLYAESDGGTGSRTIIDNTFHLSPNEERRQGLGNFRGNTSLGNESLTVLVYGAGDFARNFSVITYGHNIYNYVGAGNVSYTFQSGADYYEAVFKADAANSGNVHFKVILNQPMFSHPYLWLCQAAKALFLASVAMVMLVMLYWLIYQKPDAHAEKSIKQPLGKREKRVLLLLLALSLVLWLTFLAFNSGPLATFDNWYTDHARHTYTANLFLKDGSAVFSQPLDRLASADRSAFMFVTWPEMPHLYPVGSVLMFLPFSILVEAGVSAVLVLKFELALFLVFAHVCLYFFLVRYFSERPFPRF